MNYEAVIGLEVHVQIKAASKMFTRVATGYGRPENTLTDPVVLALPGALPVLNKAALDAIIKTGLMLGCDIATVTRWDRKNYFYPDSPKNYQLSQYDQPVCRHGSVEIELPGASLAVMGEHKSVPLTRIHLEEDVGKLNHEATDSLVDYNRAGTPLMEIVTEPALHTPDEAFAFLTSLRLSLVQAGISDCDMEKGQMRCDANISIRPVGETKLGTKVELKNLNSISYVRDGIATEIKRQLAVTAEGGVISQETRLYDGETGRSASMRSKEMAHDYRYFPDPDLMPVRIDEAWKTRLAAELPERPFDRQRRLLTSPYNLAYQVANVLINDLDRYTAFEKECAEVDRAENDPVKRQEYYRIIANLIVNDLPRVRNQFGVQTYYPQSTDSEISKYVGQYFDISSLRFPTQGSYMPPSVRPLSPPAQIQSIQQQSVVIFPTGMAPGAIASLAPLLTTGVVSASAAKTVFDFMYQTGGEPGKIIIVAGLSQSSDTSQLEAWCATAIANDAKSADQVRTGNAKAINALKGGVMKLSAGKANPKLVDEILKKQLGV